MPPTRPTLSTWISCPSPTARDSEVSGKNGSARCNVPVSASGAIVTRLQRAAGEIAVEEAVAARGSFKLGLPENPLVHRRERAGRVGIAGIARQREGLATAAAEIDLLELAASARLRHPSRA